MKVLQTLQNGSLTNKMVFKTKIYISLKSSVSDPQGLAIEGGLKQLGFASVTNVRAGKFITFTIDQTNRSDAEKTISSMCDRLLANPVIENYEFELEAVVV